MRMRIICSYIKESNSRYYSHIFKALSVVFKPKVYSRRLAEYKHVVTQFIIQQLFVL